MQYSIVIREDTSIHNNNSTANWSIGLIASDTSTFHVLQDGFETFQAAEDELVTAFTELFKRPTTGELADCVADQLVRRMARNR